jgi:hypothetical protein
MELPAARRVESADRLTAPADLVGAVVTEQYQRRLDLADIVRAALHIARARGDTRLESAARRLLLRLAEGTFRLALIGRTSRGKSTLMNAILGAPYLPTGSLPVTAVITTVRYGSRAQALVRRRDERIAAEVPLDQVRRYVTRAGVERSQQQVTAVDIELPAAFLRQGVEFVDTPGVGADPDVGGLRTRHYLPETDAALFVTAFDAPMDEEIAFLAEAAEGVEKLFVVVNKRDLVSAEVADARVAALRDQLAALGVDGPGPFPLSALEALRVRSGEDRDGRVDGGLVQLEEQLSAFLRTGSTRLLLEKVAAEARALVAELEVDLQLGQVGDDTVRTLLEEEFRRSMEELSARRRELADVALKNVTLNTPLLLAEEHKARQAELAELLQPCLDAGLSLSGDEAEVSTRAERAREHVERCGREVVGGWIERRATDLQERLIAASAAQITAMFGLYREALELPVRAVRSGESQMPKETAAWSPDDLPVVGVPTLRLSFEPRPHRSWWRRKGADQELREDLQAAVVELAFAAEPKLVAAARQWVESLDGLMERRLGEVARVFHENLRARPTEEQWAELHGLRDRLTVVQAQLNALGAAGALSGGSEGTSAPTPPVDAGGCMVCRRMADAMSAYLRGEQLRLATNTRSQVVHAETGGFCPRHTWQYAGVASPLGIAALYAQTAAYSARLLEDAASGEDDPAHRSQRVTAIAARPESCPACAVEREAERSAIEELVSGMAAQRPPNLCVGHLALLLRAAPGADWAPALVRHVAEALARSSEDLRSYAMKREAFLGGKITDEEEDARTRALVLLAGLRSLARP